MNWQNFSTPCAALLLALAPVHAVSQIAGPPPGAAHMSAMLATPACLQRGLVCTGPNRNICSYSWADVEECAKGLSAEEIENQLQVLVTENTKQQTEINQLNNDLKAHASLFKELAVRLQRDEEVIRSLQDTGEPMALPK
ncbi:hypothetical protein PTKU46_82880 [Paraburkholderia terrae]|uniref:hypothetical protein n=1 Tax=Paraburkholderia terrae TaxID=311230 RepID=UPI0030E5435E